jgi:type II secretory pathway pseudopilin PulG
MFEYNLKNKIKGFTLLEALVAISILMVAVVAPITIAQKGLSSASYSKNQMIAAYLAQDAIEFIKNKRDVNVINNKADWLDGLGVCLSGRSCKIDTNKGLGTGEITEATTPIIPLNINSGFYGYVEDPGYQVTNFTRTINMETKEINGVDDQAMITVTVGWGADSITVKTLIFNS